MLKRDALMPNDEEIEQAIRNASEITWHDWQDAFEHSGTIATNPILADAGRFKSFCAKWKVGRTIRKGTHDQFRSLLRDSPEFAEAICDDTGHKLATLENTLRTDFGTDNGARHILSALSKIAAFLRPERFVAWDQYARRGLNVVLGRPVNTPFDTYVPYLAAFERVWEGPHGERIREMTRKAPKKPLETEPRFQRRVLDLYLMGKGRQTTSQRKRQNVAAS